MTRQSLPSLLAVCGLAAVAIGQSHNSTVTPTDGVPQAVLDTFPAVVRIYVVVEESARGRMAKQHAAGSGAIVTPDGYVVTNHHVAGNASHIVCDLADRQQVPARLVGTDALADIAVLKLDTSKLQQPSSPLPTAKWGDSAKVRVGDPVFAMGSPAAISQSVTKGIIANDRMIMPRHGGGQLLDGEDNGAIVRWLAHDAVIFGGNSGGPLLSATGEIIGINEIGFANLSGAIPGNLARSVAARIIEHGSVRRSWTGLTLQACLGDEDHGALVANVVTGSPAAAAGLRAGDLLLEVGGVTTNCKVDEEVPIVTAELMDLPIGETVAARYIRNGSAQKATIDLIAREPAMHRSRELRSLGLTHRNLTKRTMRRHGLKAQEGVQVTGVRTSGPAATATPPLAAGDILLAVNGAKLGNGDALVAMIGAADGGTVVLTVRRDHEELLSAVTLAEPGKRRPPARPKRAWLPLRTQAVMGELAKALGVPSGCVRITQLLDPNKGFPLQVGDFVTACAGKPVKARRANDTAALRKLFERRPIGESVPFTVLRGGKELVIDVAMMSAPTPANQLATYEEHVLEFTCRDRSASDKAGDDDAQRGVIVTEATKGGWADLGRLQKGDELLSFGGERVADAQELEAVTNRVLAAKPARIVVQIRRSGSTRFLRIEPLLR